MKKAIIFFCVIIIVCIGILAWLRFNEPLEKAMLGRSSDYTSIFIKLGNTGFTDIQITDVYVNSAAKPTDVKMQINNRNLGFIIANDFSSSEAASYNFFNLTEAKVKSGALIQEQQNNGENEEKIYGLSIINEHPIKNVEIHYRYLGMPYKTEVKIN